MDPLLSRFASSGRGRPGIVLAVVAGAVVLVVAVLIAASGASGGEAALPAATVRSAAPLATATPLLVQVSGAVRHPGLVSLPEGSRVVDALAAAGGPASDADQQAINLAAPVADGQQVQVPVRGAATSAAAGTASGTAAPAGKVALNSATAEQLETLPRIGPALAARIIAYRTAHGAFRTIEELGEVGGIGPKTFEGLRDQVTL